ncbi:complement factor B [Nothobranchius furzeri]|uniref:C3/C5 convertase n=2 Tax=Nothobranchius furzeri TaxID=105023 RepID=A0A9D3BU26_NOTFU|nr:transcript variant X1 [Nothobranchius furzeri]
MTVKSAMWILLSISIHGISLQEYDFEYEMLQDPQPLNCSVSESIKGGHVTYSQGGLEGSVLTYHCGSGMYPFPVISRTCNAEGEWTSMRLASGKRVSQATCKDILCPAQLQLDNGDFWPRNQWFRVGMTQSFSCQEGFTLYGSERRNCTQSGDWTGVTPVCDDHADDCSDPGVPPGAERSAGRFQKGEKVTYRCQSGLTLLGSAERVCLENREWSGSAPRCQGSNTFDSPSFVTAAMAGSLAGVMDVLSPDFKKKNSSASFGRFLRVAEFSHMHVYILLDTSGSIKEADFNKSREATIALIRKLDSYDVQLNFHVLSFASETQTIVDILDLATSGNADEVILALMEFDYQSHGRRTGTNLDSALQNVLRAMSFLKQNSDHSNETQNIIIIETDGYSNRGRKPQIALAQIRSLLGYLNNTLQDHTHETMLDIYVFGVGDKVNREELNSLGSKKSNENHVFVLKEFTTLGEVFNDMISDKSVTMCGVAQEDISKEEIKHGNKKPYTRPWHVTLTSNERGKFCSGSIVSQNWVLTAAHCFTRQGKDNILKDLQLSINHGAGESKGEKVIIHQKYNISALKERNLTEFYDYDLALVKTKDSIPLSWQARPICLPCTIAASRAMKMINSSCSQHRNQLLPHSQTPAFFIDKKEERKQTHIHTQSQRDSCVEKARSLLKESTDVTLEEFVTDRFLCSGGTKGYQDEISCKGDSGGSLVLEKRKRYFQVGVVSWGTIHVCDQHLHSSSNLPRDARDFHIDLFKVMPWLKEHLGNEIHFLPENN